MPAHEETRCQEDKRQRRLCQRHAQPRTRSPDWPQPSSRRFTAGVFPPSFFKGTEHRVETGAEVLAGFFLRQKGQLLPQRRVLTTIAATLEMLLHRPQLVTSQTALQVVRKQFGNLFTIH